MYEIEFARDDWENSTVDEKAAKILIKRYEKDLERIKKKRMKRKSTSKK